MRDYKIVTDSCSDITRDLREKYDIDYMRMHLIIDNKEEIWATTDWETYSAKEVYDMMRNGVRIKTAQVPTEEITNTFTKYLEEGKDILYIACSSALSGTVNTATVIAKDLLEKYPEAKIFCVDARNSCRAEMLMAIKAAELKAEGKTIDEAAAYIEENKQRFRQFATVDSLEYLRRAGRVKASSAFFGNLFGVKPIIVSDILGNNHAVKKVKGRKSSFVEIVNMIKDCVIEPENQTLWVVHADCYEDAATIRDMIMAEVPFRDCAIDYIGPCIGVSTGPGMIGVYCVGTEETTKGE